MDVKAPEVERLDLAEYPLVKPLLVQLYLSEQPHYTDHPQLSESELAEGVGHIEGTFLGENVTASAFAGLMLILAGVALGTGTLRLPRRAPAPETP